MEIERPLFNQESGLPGPEIYLIFILLHYVTWDRIYRDLKQIPMLLSPSKMFFFFFFLKKRGVLFKLKVFIHQQYLALGHIVWRSRGLPSPSKMLLFVESQTQMFYNCRNIIKSIYSLVLKLYIKQKMKSIMLHYPWYTGIIILTLFDNEWQS